MTAIIQFGGAIAGIYAFIVIAGTIVFPEGNKTQE